MKNPFVKQNHTLLISTIVFGSLAAGAITYLFLTESGSEVRGKVKREAKENVKKLVAELVSKKTGISKKAVKKAADLAVK